MGKKKKDSHSIIERDPEKTAELAGLEYVNDQLPGITRKKKGSKFVYISPSGKIITEQSEIDRINALVIPPAYQEVWICVKKNGHLQATGKDARGRKQYRYHSLWKKVREENKYHRLVAFGKALPLIRKKVTEDLALKTLSKDKLLALVVHLLEVTLIRVGNEEYARENNSFGLTTFRNRHVHIEGTKITFKFRGKSGQMHTIDVKDRRLANVIKKCKELPGQELFEYKNENGEIASISSTDVNHYLHEITKDHFTAKDFRTWTGTVLAVFALQEFEQFDSDVQAKKNIVQAVEKVAKKLGNTPSVCRKCYIHPEVINAYLDGTLMQMIKERAEKSLTDSLSELTSEETAVLAFLKQRLELELKKRKHS